MKILYVITRSTWGGAQAHLLGLISDQVRRKNKVVLVVGNEGELTKRVRKFSEVKILVVDDLVRTISPIKDFKSVCALRRIIAREKPDIIHLHSSKAGIIGRTASLGKAQKVVFTAHGWSFTEGVGRGKQILYRSIERFFSRFADKIICVSKYDKLLAINNLKLSNDKVVAIYNGVEIDPISEESFDRQNVNIVMVARFDKQKNQKELIKAFAASTRKDITLTFVGSGPTEHECQVLVNSLKLTGNVKFLGYQTNVKQILEDASIFALITNYEGLPISILEAMERGLPILATNVGGINEEVVDGYNGHLVSNNANEINNAISDIVDHGLEFGKASRELVKKNFTLDRCVESVNEVYEELSRR